MNVIGLSLLAILGSTDRSPSLSTTLPGGTWEASAALGAAEIGTGGGPTLGWEAELSVGVTDQLQLNILWPGVVLRLGSPPDVEYVLAAGIWDVRSNPAFAALSYELGAALGVRTWYGRAVAAAVTLEASNTRPWGFTPLSVFFTATVGAGLTLSLGDMVVVHLALAATNTSDVLSDFWQTAPRLGVGSVQRLGFRRLPLVEVHPLSFLSADLLAAVWAPFPYQGPYSAEVLLGATVQFP